MDDTAWRRLKAPRSPKNAPATREDEDQRLVVNMGLLNPEQPRATLSDPGPYPMVARHGPVADGPS